MEASTRPSRALLTEIALAEDCNGGMGNCVQPSSRPAAGRQPARRDGAISDCQLLADFVSQRNIKVFEVLVWRHGTMVLSLCQRILHNTHAAEDAFQATFLIFARKAAAIGKREAVSSWLFKVAYRVALRMRGKEARRPVHEATAEELPAREAPDDVLWHDLRLVLDPGNQALPKKAARVPVGAPP